MRLFAIVKSYYFVLLEKNEVKLLETLSRTESVMKFYAHDYYGHLI